MKLKLLNKKRRLRLLNPNKRRFLTAPEGTLSLVLKIISALNLLMRRVFILTRYIQMLHATTTHKYNVFFLWTFPEIVEKGETMSLILK